MPRAYLDHAASTAVHPTAMAAMVARLGTFGNASSLHTPGREQRRVLEESRESLAALTGLAPTEVIFTSGGTEANNLAIKGYYRKAVRHSPQRQRIVVGGTEHPSVIAVARALVRDDDAELAIAPVDAGGRIDTGELRRLLAAPERVALVAVMAANNDTGTIAPLEEIAGICSEAGVWWHCDAVQAAPWLDMRWLSGLAPYGGGFSIAISGHKLGAPVGIGALLGFTGDELQPLCNGGGQERGARPGTSPVALVASLVAAARSADRTRAERANRVRALRDELLAGVTAVIPDVVVHTPLSSDDGLPGHGLISFVGADADSLLLLLDADAVAVSAGSACSAGLTRTSPVLTAMGVDRGIAKAAIRFSLGWNTSAAEIDHALRVLPAAVAKARKVGQSRGAARGLAPERNTG